MVCMKNSVVMRVEISVPIEDTSHEVEEGVACIQEAVAHEVAVLICLI